MVQEEGKAKFNLFLSLLLIFIIQPVQVRSQEMRPSDPAQDNRELKIEADTLTTRADSLFEIDKGLAEAAELYKRARGIYRQLKLREYEGYVLQNQGRCYEK